MNQKQKERMCATAALEIALHCVRNTELENLHSGDFPVTLTGDYSDVKIIDGTGSEIAWTDLMRLNDEEMKSLMKEVVNKIYTYLLHGDDPNLALTFNQIGQDIRKKLDKPEIDKSFASIMSMDHHAPGIK